MTPEVTRRASERFVVDREVTVEIGGSRFRGRLVDVSDRGAFVRLSIDLLSDETMQIELPDRSVRASADIRRITDNGVGILFTDADRGKDVSDWAQAS